MTPNVASVESSAVHLIASSSRRGISIVMSAPTAGMKTTRVRAQSSNAELSIEPIFLRLGGVPEHGRERCDCANENECVQLQPAGLNPAGAATCFGRDGADAVHEAVYTL